MHQRYWWGRPELGSSGGQQDSNDEMVDRESDQSFLFGHQTSQVLQGCHVSFNSKVWKTTDDDEKFDFSHFVNYLSLNLKKVRNIVCL